MRSQFLLTRKHWDEAIFTFFNEFNVYAPIQKWDFIDYMLIDEKNLNAVIYNHPKPATPLKSFFLPVKQNVNLKQEKRDKIIMGVPACDLKGLELLDEIYLDKDLPDTVYQYQREHTILIGTDCHQILEHCHCTTYGTDPFPNSMQDLTLNSIDDMIILQSFTEKGEKLLSKINGYNKTTEPPQDILDTINQSRKSIVDELNQKNKLLPDYKETGNLVKHSNGTVWKKFAENCVSCGACATSCPTCTCFLFIDRPGFEKVRNIDACQFPGFERVAAGEDPLHLLINRFKNRYMCKYVLKTAKYNSIACTGCGRCIEACIGKINKNELFLELKEKEKV